MDNNHQRNSAERRVTHTALHLFLSHAIEPLKSCEVLQHRYIFSSRSMLYFIQGSGSPELLCAYEEIDDGSYPFCR